MQIPLSLRIAATLLAAASLQASDWGGANGSWSSNSTPGWNGTGVPNAIGAVAGNNGGNGGFNVSTTLDIFAGVTVGTISLTHNNDAAWNITGSSNTITLNQDGAGPGTATVLNSNLSASFDNYLYISTKLTLADNLLVSNTGASKNLDGAIVITGIIAGTGDITFRNSSSALTLGSSISLTTGTNTFTGSVFIEKGTVVYARARSFGNIANVITLGAVGQGKASMLTSTNLSIENPLVVAADAGGTLTVGSAPGTSFSGFAGPVTLNGDLTVDAVNTVAFYHNISGSGGIIKTSTGTLLLTQATTYTGNTTLAPGSGSIGLSHTDALSMSTLDYTGSSVYFDSAVVPNTFTFGGLTGSASLTLQNNLSAAIALRVGGNDSSTAYTGQLTGPGSLEKIGSGSLTLSRADGHTYAGGTTVSTGLLFANNATGSATGLGAVVVQAAGTLGGTGFIGGDTTVSGTLSPGNGVGTLSFATNLTLNSGSSTAIELGGLAPGAFDSISADGILVYGGTLNLSLVNGFTPQIGDTFELFRDFNSASGSFSNITFSDPNIVGQFTPGSGTLSIVAIPEPSAWVLVALGLLFVLARASAPNQSNGRPSSRS